MKRKAIVIFFCSFFISVTSIFGQFKGELTKEDKTSLEGIIAEKYYVSTKDDSKDTSGGFLPKGSTTYRIYVDLKAGYHLQDVFGVEKHEMYFKTTTKFFNNKFGGQSGDQVPDQKINDNTIALDSWVTIGMASKSYQGVLKSEDKDGSIIKRSTLDKTDGLVLATGQIKKMLTYGIDLGLFSDEKNASNFHSNNGSLACVGGGKGPTEENKVLIAQLTTNGKLSFEFNIQVGNSRGETIQFVAKNPEGKEIEFKQLTYK